MKMSLRRLLGHYPAFWSKPHITFALKKINIAHELELLSQIEAECREHEPFNVRLNGFDIFIESRTIFVSTEPDPFLNDLINGLRSVAHKISEDLLTEPKPHITIGKGMFGRDQFLKACRSFLWRSYIRSMIVPKIFLLRRGINPRTHYEMVKEFRLGRTEPQ